MTPRLVALALRAIAHGAPEPRYESGGMGHALPGEVEVGGLLYERVVVEGVPRLLPVLKHWSWLGWTLTEVERRGYWWALSARGAWSVVGPSQASGDPCDRPVALVAMLEATCPKS